MLDAATAQTLREIVVKGAMPPLVLVVDDCRAALRPAARPRGGACGDSIGGLTLVSLSPMAINPNTS